MQKKMENFLVDLIREIQEKYNQSLLPTEDEGLEDKNFRLGVIFSYYDLLDVIESQLKSFGYTVEEIGQITPILGKRINLQ